VTGVLSVVFFIVNAAFALILLILVLIASVYAIVSKNPDTRYQPMRDDRGSFIKSQTQLTTELDALGATARGDAKSRDLEDDATSVSSGSLARHQGENQSPYYNGSGVGAPQNTGRQPPHSPVDPSMPLFPSSDGPARRGPPPSYDSRGMYHNGYGGSDYGVSRSQSNSPVPRTYGNSPFPGAPSTNSNPHQFRMQNNASPWQRGAGYE
jgi:hypothetical protein